MHTRSCFVSNSSSSSFIIPLAKLTADQIAKAKDYYDVAMGMTTEIPGDKYERQWVTKRYLDDPDFVERVFIDTYWKVWEENGYLMGSTYMDNFDFEDFLIRIGVPSDLINMGEELPEP